MSTFSNDAVVSESVITTKGLVCKGVRVCSNEPLEETNISKEMGEERVSPDVTFDWKSSKKRLVVGDTWLFSMSTSSVPKVVISGEVGKNEDDSFSSVRVCIFAPGVTEFSETKF